MGPISSFDPPSGALSNPSNGKEPVSVLDWCQGCVKSRPAKPDAGRRMQDARSAHRPIHHQNTKSTKHLLIHHHASAHSNPVSASRFVVRGATLRIV